MSKPVLVSLFSGAGGLDHGLERAGFEPVVAVEMDPDCCLTLAKNRPGLKIIQRDVATVTGDEVLSLVDRGNGEVDLLAGGPPCFSGDTMVLTKSGYVRIDQVNVGDVVLTHMGRWRKVTAVMETPRARVVSVKAQGVPGIICTPEHPFYARERIAERFKRNGKWGYRRAFSAPGWVDAKDLGPVELSWRSRSNLGELKSGRHYVGQRLPAETTEDRHAPEFWRLVGRWLADGWLVRQKHSPRHRHVAICEGRHERGEVEKIVADAGFKCSLVEVRTCNRFVIYSTALHDFLERFGRYAHGKTIPGFVFELPKEKAAALIEGYLSGDGWRDDVNGTTRVITVSKSLGLGMALLAQRAFGIVASMRFQKKERWCVIEGRKVKQRSYWVVFFPDRNRSGFIEGDFGWKLAKTVVPAGRRKVYNIAVEEDESYVADGAVVHNCQPFSAASRHRTGDTPRLNDPRAATLRHFLRLVEEVQPKAWLMENVDAFAAEGRDEGLQLVLEEVKAINERTGSKYLPYRAVLNAAQFGVPQTRKRLFVVASRAGSDWYWPMPTHAEGGEGGLEKFRTAWDALGDLPLPAGDDLEALQPSGKWARLLPCVPEGWNYSWHTKSGQGPELFGRGTRYWNFLLKLAKSRPSWTITASVGPGIGPFHWTSRSLSVREAMRLQTFPDDVEIVGDYRSGMRQVGNAVPSLVGEVLGRALIHQFLGGERRDDPLTLMPPDRSPPPKPEEPAPLPPELEPLVGNYAEHPGAGRGPGAVRRKQEADGAAAATAAAEVPVVEEPDRPEPEAGPLRQKKREKRRKREERKRREKREKKAKALASRRAAGPKPAAPKKSRGREDYSSLPGRAARRLIAFRVALEGGHSLRRGSPQIPTEVFRSECLANGVYDRANFAQDMTKDARLFRPVRDRKGARLGWSLTKAGEREAKAALAKGGKAKAGAGVRA